MTRTTLSAVFAMATAVTFCSDGSGGGPTGPPGDSLEGTYATNHTIEVTSGALSFTITCTGPLVIITQSGSNFSGTATIDDCSDVPGQEEEFLSGTEVFSGTIMGAEVEFVIEDFAEAIAEGCTVVAIDDHFAGTASSNRIDLTFQASMVCEGTPIELDWDIAATLVS